MTDTYIGSSKVADSKVLDNGLVEVTLVDPQGQPPVILFTTEQFEAVKSDAPYPDGEVSQKKWKMVVAKVVEIFVSNNMEIVDQSYVVSRIDEAIKSMYAKAVAKKFDVAYLEKIPLKVLLDMVE